MRQKVGQTFCSPTLEALGLIPIHQETLVWAVQKIKTSQIARMLGVSSKTVRSRLTRARCSLRIDSMERLIVETRPHVTQADMEQAREFYLNRQAKRHNIETPKVEVAKELTLEPGKANLIGRTFDHD